MNEPAPKDRDLEAYAIAAVIGLVHWWFTVRISGRREPWDATVYWTFSYPLAIALGAGLGWSYPTRPWRWALTLMCMQMVVMTLGGSGLGLLPLGLVLMGVLALPAMALANWLGRRRMARDAADVRENPHA